MPKIPAFKFRTKLLFLILISGCFFLSLFLFLWRNIGNAWDLVKDTPPFVWGEKELIEELRKDAMLYDLPDYDKGKNQTEKMERFFSHADEYTGVYVYGEEDGYYRAGKSPGRMDDLVYGTILQWGFSLSDLYTDPQETYRMEFKNGVIGNVYIYSYHNMRFVYPYIIFISAGCIFSFFATVLLYTNKRINQILRLNNEVLLMASGDLSHPVPPCGRDEIGSLAAELDALRRTLMETLEKESNSRQANQDLITAMSHDLRTPLTILKGYLEVLKLKRNEPALAEDYIERCLKKADEIKEMTDKMFEYSLVFEEKEDMEPEQIDGAFLEHCLRENIDFLQLAGFQVPSVPHFQNSESLAAPAPHKFNSEPYTTQDSLSFDKILLGDKTMIKRIFNNLCSNILKYGEKSIPVRLECMVAALPESRRTQMEAAMLEITLSNHVKADCSDVASNGIGLKSVKKMMELQQGWMQQSEVDGCYTVTLCFPLRETELKTAAFP